MATKHCFMLLLSLVPLVTSEQGSGLKLAKTPAAAADQCTGTCSDLPPDDLFTCKQQTTFGACNQPWMKQGGPDNPEGYCQQSCGRCKAGCPPPADANATCECIEVPPNKEASCEQQAELGNCRTPFMLFPNALASHGYCASACAACPLGCKKSDAPACPCSEEQPSVLGLTCAQVVSRKLCQEAWVSTKTSDRPEGYCQASCRRCPCDNVAPSQNFTCEEQRAFGKCNEPWMLAKSAAAPKGFCQISCGRCNVSQACPEYAANVLKLERVLAASISAPSEPLPPSSAQCVLETCAIEAAPGPARAPVQYHLPPPSITPPNHPRRDLLSQTEELVVGHPKMFVSQTLHIGSEPAGEVRPQSEFDASNNHRPPRALLANPENLAAAIHAAIRGQE